MQVITQMFINNQGHRLTVELINGMNLTIKSEFDRLTNQLEAKEAECSELRKQLEELAPELSSEHEREEG